MVLAFSVAESNLGLLATLPNSPALLAGCIEDLTFAQTVPPSLGLLSAQRTSSSILSSTMAAFSSLSVGLTGLGDGLGRTGQDTFRVATTGTGADVTSGAEIFLPGCEGLEIFL